MSNEDDSSSIYRDQIIALRFCRTVYLTKTQLKPDCFTFAMKRACECRFLILCKWRLTLERLLFDYVVENVTIDFQVGVFVANGFNDCVVEHCCIVRYFCRSLDACEFCRCIRVNEHTDKHLSYVLPSESITFIYGANKSFSRKRRIILMQDRSCLTEILNVFVSTECFSRDHSLLLL